MRVVVTMTVELPSMISADEFKKGLPFLLGQHGGILVTQIAVGEVQ